MSKGPFGNPRKCQSMTLYAVNISKEQKKSQNMLDLRTPQSLCLFAHYHDDVSLIIYTKRL